MRRIAQLRDRDPEIKQSGGEAVVVLCQKRAAVEAWLKDHPVPFPVLADDDRSNARRWGVWVRLNFESVNIARPASFVVDRDGVVAFAHVSRIQFGAAELDDVIAAMRSAAG